jgi:hypothetical protein
MLSPRLPHAFSALAATAAIALGGCGGGGDEASSSLDEALGYLSDDAGFAFVASTDLDDYDDTRKLVDKFPFGGRIEDSLKNSLEQEGVDFEDEIRPLLGNEVVIGTDDNASLVSDDEDTPFVLALETEDEDKLRDLVEKDGREQGTTEGHDVFQGQEDDTWIAIKDAVFVLSNDEDTLKNALEQRGEDDRLTEDDLDAALEDLPADAPVRGYANVAALIAASPDAKDALKVNWVDHLETLGFTADVDEDGVSLDYFARTEAGLSDDELPLASGSDAPRLLDREGDSAEIALSLRDPSQVIDFALATAKVVDPAGYAQFQTGKEATGRRLGIDVDDDVLAQLTGDVAGVISIDGRFGVRAELEDADAFEGALAKIMDGLPEFSDDLAVTKPKGADAFYGLTTAGGQSYAVGVAEGSLVIANDVALARDVATRKLVDAEGQEGAFVASADAEKLANEALARYAGGLQGIGGSLFTGPLGNLLLSAEASTEGIRGSQTLEVD